MALILSLAAFAASPGLNALTGTTEPETFDDMTSLPSTVKNAVLDDSPISGDSGKVLRHYVGESITSEYATIGFAFNPALDRNRPYQISFKAYKWSSDASVGVTNTELWIMKNGTAGWQIAQQIGSFASGKNSWYEHSYNVATFGSLTNKNTGAIDTTDINTVYFEWHYDSLSSYNSTEKIYIDDVSIIPAYKVTYLDEDGTELKVTYESLTGSSFEPIVSVADANNGIIGWSKANDGTVDESIVLNNTDLTLYAVYDNNLNFNLKADKTLLIKSGDVASLTTNLWHRNGVDGITVSYSVAEGASFVTLKDNGNGSATVTAKAEGLATITCKASTGETEDICILCDYHTIDVEQAVQTVPTIAASNWLYDHTGATFDETEGAWAVRKRTDVLKPDGTTYYNNGFLSISASVDTSTYKYLLFRVKADRSTSFQVRMNKGGTYYSATYPTIAATTGQYVDVAVDISTPVSQGTISQYVLGVTNHHDTVYIKDITLSNIPTYEPEIPEIKVLKLIKTASTLSGDGASASVQAQAFSNKASAVNVAWKSSDSCVAVKNDGNGYATLKAMSDGTATITAYVSGDESISESFNVTVSGQREKQAVYDIRILFWGASTTKHGPAASLGWYGDWGMAASAEENDYVHKLVSYLEEEYYPSKVTFEIIANSEWDAAISPETDVNKDWTTHAKYLEIESAVKTLRPNIIMTAQTGNMKADANGDVAYNAYKQMYDMMFSYCPDAIIVAQYCGTWHSAMKEEFMARLGQNYSDKNFFLLHNDVAGVPEYLAPEFENSGVANHWGDKGHERVAQQCFALANPVIPAVIEPTYIYIPESIEINGESSISDKGSSIQLTVKATPSDASTDVSWSVDNTDIAIISKNGLLSALNNGTVTVTATSSFDDSVKATHTVKITGQTDTYTLTYAAGTTDTVTGLPEADEYAGSNYTLSSAIPLRDKYTFIGWGLNENASETVTTLDVKENTTVYAIWKKTDGFEFDGEYDENAGFIYGFSIDGGFHAKVSDGHLWSTCTAGTKVNFKTPVLEIFDANILSFGLTSAYTDENGTVELTVKTTSGNKVYVFPLTSTGYTTYVADISALSGAVTGVEIYVNAAPTDNAAFDISLDYIRFSSVTSLNKDETEFVVTDGNVYVSSLDFSDAFEITTSAENTDKIRTALDSGYSVILSGTDKVYAGGVKNGANITVNVLTNGSIFTKSIADIYTFDGTAFAENEVLSDSLASYNVSSIRTKEPQGIRAKASVSSNLYLEDTVEEYGFAISRYDYITSGKIADVVMNDEYLSKGLVLYGKTFCKSDNIHKVYEKDDETEVYAAVLTNIPMRKDALTTVLVFRPYIKLSNGSFVYGTPISKTPYEVAVSLYYDSNTDETSKAAAWEIIQLVGDPLDKDIGIDLDDLFS